MGNERRDFEAMVFGGAYLPADRTVPGTSLVLANPEDGCHFEAGPLWRGSFEELLRASNGDPLAGEWDQPPEFEITLAHPEDIGVRYQDDDGNWWLSPFYEPGMMLDVSGKRCEVLRVDHERGVLTVRAKAKR